jgi:peptidyl-prolyl cis-trans isomerase SurA
MKKAKLILPLLMLLLLAATPLRAWERLDQIVAVVGNKVILSSELEFQAQMYAVQAGIKVDNDEQLKAVEKELLRQMINDRLILMKALEDTTIKVSDEEADAALQQRIDDLRNNFASQDEFDKQLAAEGLTFRELKVRLREEVKDQIYKEKLITKLLSKVSVTRAEVEDFFKTYRDSLPEHPQSVRLARLLLVPSSSEQMQDSLRAFAESLRDSIVNGGESFEKLAKEYSQDVSAPEGGDIGTFNKGDLLPEFERAALALNPGEVSGVVKTKLGYHIIKLISKNGDTFHCEHILLMNHPAQSDSTKVLELANSIEDSLKNGADWGALVKEYSADEKNKATFGELGWFAVRDLPEDFTNRISGLEVGAITQPFWADDGLQILKVVDRQEARPFSLDQDWDILKEYTRRQKSESVIASIVDEMKDKVYLELRGL